METNYNRLLWIANLGAPVIWFVHLSVCFLLVPPSCDHGVRWPLHLASAIALAISISAGLIAAHLLRGLPPANDRSSWTFARMRFMARLGIGSSLFFSLVIVASSLPSFLSECGAP
jgi:hypothetical protein